MSCPPSSDRILRLLRQLSARVRTLTCWFSSLTRYWGWTDGPVLRYAELLSRTWSGGVYTVSFRSIPGRRYSIQESTDQVTWMTVDAVQSAAAAPALLTVWTSPARPQTPPVYFRIVLLPDKVYHCYTQSEAGQNALSSLCLYSDQIASLD